MSEPTPSLDGLPSVPGEELPTFKQYNKTGLGRHYKHTVIGDLPSVTNCLGILDKQALNYWGVNVEREMVIERAAQFFKDCDGQLQGPKHAIVTMLRNYLPKQQARFKKAKEGADVGSETHLLVQNECKRILGLLPEQVPEATEATEGAEIAFMAWEEWAERVKLKLKPLLVEQVVFSRRMKAAGTCDLFGEQDWPAPGQRRNFAYDWKSNKPSKSQPDGIYDESLVQVATYADMLVEMGVAPPNTMACIVRLPKTLDKDKEPFWTSGKLDTAEIMPNTRVELADTFHNIRKTWGNMKERKWRK